MKKVCNVNENDKTIIQNLYQNREGLRVKTLIKLTNLKQRTIYKRLNILKEKGLIENIFPVWKIVNGQIGFCATLIKSSNIFELHNLSYVVKLIRTPDWWNKRKNYLMKLNGWEFKNINFGNGGTNPYQQLINENWVIQCYPESVIIIARKRYYSNQPYEVIIEAMNEFYDLWEWFEERMRFKFFLDGVPQAFIRNNDFNRMKDHLAEHCKKEDTRFLIKIDKNRKVWVDYSEPFGKEANYPEGQEKLERVTKDILTNEALLPSQVSHISKNNTIQIKDLVNVVSNNQQMLTGLPIILDGLKTQIKSHLRLIQEYRKENKIWRKVKEREINKLKSKEQLKLSKWL